MVNPQKHVLFDYITKNKTQSQDVLIKNARFWHSDISKTIHTYAQPLCDTMRNDLGNTLRASYWELWILVNFLATPSTCGQSCFHLSPGLIPGVDRVGKTFKTFLPVKQCTQFEEMHADGCGDIPYVCVSVFVQKKKGKHLTTRIQVWQQPI